MQRDDSDLFYLEKKKKSAPLYSFNVFIPEASHIQNNIAKISNR